MRSAKERTDQMHSNISCGKSKPKKHAGDFSLVAWDKEGMKTEFNNYPEGTVVNWFSITRKYNITDGKGKIAPNGGQIVKDWLSTQGIDVEKFTKQTPRGDGPIIRRKILKGSSGEIFPCSEPIEKTREKLKRKIEEGEYSIGE